MPNQKKTTRHIITQKDREESFSQIMYDVRRRLPRSTRWFSDFIHKPNIERLSDALGNTIARPDAILAGSLTAFLSILSLYSYAKFAGFALHGSETVIAFAVGWLIGLAFDGIKTIITRKR